MSRLITIFYSWQSDLPSRHNKNFINSCLEKAVKKISKKVRIDLNIEINIDRDTSNKSGSPNVAETIFSKIKKADIFISDVSCINNNLLSKIFRSRLTPNPNVLTELGFAIHLLGWERIVCINNLKFGTIENLPFDIRGHRISTYNSSNKDEKEKLTELLVNAIQNIILDYEKIEERHLENGFRRHDLNIYNTINSICSESLLNESISVAIHSLFTNKYYYHKWRDLRDYYDLSTNHFLDKDLDSLYQNFIVSLTNFHMCCATNFHSNKRYTPSIHEYEENGDAITDDLREEVERAKIYQAHKDPFEGETWPESDIRIQHLQDELEVYGIKVKETYGAFMLKVKSKLLT